MKNQKSLTTNSKKRKILCSSLGISLALTGGVLASSLSSCSSSGSSDFDGEYSLHIASLQDFLDYPFFGLPMSTQDWSSDPITDSTMLLEAGINMTPEFIMGGVLQYLVGLEKWHETGKQYTSWSDYMGYFFNKEGITSVDVQISFDFTMGTTANLLFINNFHSLIKFNGIDRYEWTQLIENAPLYAMYNNIKYSNMGLTKQLNVLIGSDGPNYFMLDSSAVKALKLYVFNNIPIYTNCSFPNGG